MVTDRETRANRSKYAEIAELGEAIYARHRVEIEGLYSGQYIAINVKDGRYAIGSTGLDAIDNAKKICGDQFVGYLRGVGFVEFAGNV